MSALLKLESNAHHLGAEIESLAGWINGVDYARARDAMRDIAGMLVQSVRDTMLAQEFVPLSEATTEYKRRKGLDARILFATGRTFGNLDPAYGPTWARAYRGMEQWYAFLHDSGVGVAQWSREGEERKRASKARRHRDRKQFSEGRIPLVNLGLTRFPKRQIFVIRADAEESILARYDLFLQTACDEVQS